MYVGSNVFVLASVEFGVSKLSVAFVDVPSFVHNNSTKTFVSGFYNYILLLFKLAYGLSFCSIYHARFREKNSLDISVTVLHCYTVVSLTNGRDQGTSILHMRRPSTRCYTVLQAVTGCYTVLQGVTRCYTLLHAVTGCYTV